MGLKRFDFKLKDDKKKKSIIGASIIVLVLLIGVTIYATYAKYKDVQSYNIIQGRVSEFTSSDLSVAIKLVDTNGNETIATDFPNHLEYAYLKEQSACDNGSTITWNEGEWSATISASAKDKCTIYFEQRSTKNLKDAILANNTLITETPDFSVAATEENTNIYKTTDDLGDSYYFRGAVTNNYVSFGGFYWRIVRTNGDGSIRLAYDGTELINNGVAHIATLTKQTDYNASWDDEKYVGYTYDNGIQTDSTIKEVLDDWYFNNLKTYSKFITDAIYCNDREETKTEYKNTSGTTVETEAESVGYCKYYAPYDRIRDNKPELTCTKDADKYTVNSSIGNGLLDNPVGLITADEMVMAGAPYGSANTEFYMYNTNKFYTSSPYYYCSYQDGARVWNFGNTMKDGVLYGDLVDCSYYARPVINLDSNIRMYGSGTMSDPYRLTKEL